MPFWASLLFSTLCTIFVLGGIIAAVEPSETMDMVGISERQPSPPSLSPIEEGIDSQLRRMISDYPSRAPEQARESSGLSMTTSEFRICGIIFAVLGSCLLIAAIVFRELEIKNDQDL